MTPSPNLNQFNIPCKILNVASWLAFKFLRRQVKWSGILISFRLFQFVLIHTGKGFSVVNEAEVDVILEFPYIFCDPMGVWSLVLLPFLNPACTSGSSQFTYCWSLAWRILSITLLACEMCGTVWKFEHSLALPFFGIVMKTDFNQPLAADEFSKFAGILSAAF